MSAPIKREQQNGGVVTGLRRSADRALSGRVDGLDAARPILDLIAQPVVVTDGAGVILYWNPASVALYGYTAQDAVGQSVTGLLGNAAEPDVLEALRTEIFGGRPWSGELVSRTADGTMLTLMATITPLLQGQPTPAALIATSVDVSAAVNDRALLATALALVEQQSDELRHQALHDTLTGLPNRALLLDRAEQMLVRARRQHTPVAALAVDLDGFKDVNDTFGRDAGDQLLKAVARRLSRALRQSDTVGRLGDDEFVVIVEGNALDAGADLVAERILEVLRVPFPLTVADGTAVSHSCTASIGIAEGNRDGADELFRDADMALYRAQSGGRNRFEVFASDMRAANHDRLILETELRVALQRGQFFLEYQPTFDLSQLSTNGIEALLRWRHPIRGVVPPLEFIAKLEETKMILAVGRWVLAEACRQGALWHRMGYPLAVAVNVSAVQLESDAFAAEVDIALTSSGLAPGALILEITESVLMRDAPTTTARLNALKATGVKIAIDDFGTGYSSLAYLRQFPVDILKIDRSFVQAIDESPEADALLHTLVQLGQQLGLELIAEGIETGDQLRRLQDQDCNTGQGYLIARPMAADNITEFLQHAHTSQQAQRA